MSRFRRRRWSVHRSALVMGCLSLLHVGLVALYSTGYPPPHSVDIIEGGSLQAHHGIWEVRHLCFSFVPLCFLFCFLFVSPLFLQCVAISILSPSEAVLVLRSSSLAAARPAHSLKHVSTGKLSVWSRAPAESASPPCPAARAGSGQHP